MAHREMAHRETSRRGGAAGVVRIFLALSVLALLSFAPPAAVGQTASGPVHALELEGQAEVLRVVLETGVGVVSGVTAVRAPEPALRIELKDATADQVAAIAAAAARPQAYVRDVRVERGVSGRVLLIVRLARPLQIVGETVIAAPGGRSRWEVVMAEDRAPAAPAAARPAVASRPRLDKLFFVAEADRLDIVLDGSAALEAELDVTDQPPALVIGFPGLPPAAVEAALAQVTSLPPFLRQARVSTGPDRSARLQFDLRGLADQVDATGLMLGERSRLIVSLVPDAAPETGPAAGGRQVTAIETVDQGGDLQVGFAGAGNARVNTFSLSDPPRLVVDLLGVRPSQVQAAVRAFRSAHPVVRAAALTETRLGSARVVFALSTPVAIAPERNLGALAGRPDRIVVGLRAVDLVPPSDTQFAGVPGLDLRINRIGRDEPRGPTIRPTELGSVRNAPPTPPGRRFSLVEVLETALDRDPRYAAAKADTRAIAEGVDQARADYLPVAAFDYQRSLVRNSTIRAPNPAFPVGTVNYPSQGLSLTLTQPLFRLAALRRMDQAGLGVEQSRLNMLAAEQDLILRVASAYLNLLAATDARDLARAEREATARELDLARTRQTSGLAAPAQLYEVEARNAMAEAREIDAERAIEDARYAMKEIVGEEVASVRGLRRDFVAVPPVPSRAEDWVEAAAAQNLPLQARSLAVQIAQLEIERQRAGHYPTADFVASGTKQDEGGSLYGGSQKTENLTAGIRIRVPLFEGGRTSSLVREAVARHDRSVREREEELRRSERVVRSAFRSVNANISSMEALRKSVQAQEAALVSRVEGYRSGVSSIVNVVDAYRLYFAAYRDYLQVRYDYLLNRLRLKQSVGTLSRNDLQDLTAMLD